MLEECLESRAVCLCSGTVRCDSALGVREIPVGDYLVGVEFLTVAQSVAFRAGTKRGIEGEESGLGIGNRNTAVGTGVLLVVELPLSLVEIVNLNQASRHLGSLLDCFAYPRSRLSGVAYPVDDDGNVVFDVFFQIRKFVLERVHRPVDFDLLVARLLRVLEKGLELPLLPSCNGTENDKLSVLGMGEDEIDYLVDCYFLDFTAALRAVDFSDSRPEKTVVVIYLGNRSDSRTGVAVRRLLLDSDGGTEAFD